MASGDSFTIKVKGRQTHGAVPWGGVDPIVVGSQIVMALQTIVSRTVNITEAPAVVTVGRFTGGNRSNIVPEEVELEGTCARSTRACARTSTTHPQHRHEHRRERRRDGDGGVTASATR